MRKTRRFGRGHAEGEMGGRGEFVRGCAGGFGRTMRAARAGGRRVRRFAGPKTQVDLKLGRRLAGRGGGGRDGVFLAISEYRG